jgi:hypothetical protein
MQSLIVQESNLTIPNNGTIFCILGRIAIQKSQKRYCHIVCRRQFVTRINYMNFCFGAIFEGIINTIPKSACVSANVFATLAIAQGSLAFVQQGLLLPLHLHERMSELCDMSCDSHVFPLALSATFPLSQLHCEKRSIMDT